MPPQSRRRIGRKRLAVVAPLTFVLCVAMIVVALRTASRNERESVESPISGIDLETAEAIEAAGGSSLLSDRPVYRYSVIPGGVYTASELRGAIQADAVVAAHYQDLDQSKLQVKTVARDQYAYVSYRKGDKVFWTKNKVLLRQGETIVTDGTKQIRGRCGNCISEEPQLPTAANEPDAVEFDRLVDKPSVAQPLGPEVALVPLTSLPATGTPAGDALAEALAPFGPRRTGGGIGPFVAGGNGSNVPAPPGDVPGAETPMPPIVPEPPVVFPLPPGLFPTPPTVVPTPPGDLFPPTGNDPPLDQPPPREPPIDLPPTSEPVPVPEPGTLLLIAAGAVTAACRRRSRAN